MADKKKATGPKPPATADRIIRDLRSLGERRGWRPTASGIDGDGRVTVTFELPKEEEAQG